MKNNKFHKNSLSIIKYLYRDLLSGYYSIEELSKNFKIPRAEIQRAFQYLRIQPGWSIQINNTISYGRQNKMIRNRPKGTKYQHDTSEPDWQRTYYKVIRPI